jgi:hypothetical protein
VTSSRSLPSRADHCRQEREDAHPKSTDNGSTFGSATVVVDEGSDKDWLAIGPDPKDRDRDNIYVTWTSFQVNAKGQMDRTAV